jgi:O-antigen/teichoic acid export membrane protein
MDALQLLAKIKTDLKSVFFRNMLVLMSGTAFAQIITVSFAPVLSRIYDPDAFGVFGVYLSYASIVGTVATLQYEQALMLPKSVEDAVNLLGLSTLCVLATTILAALVCIPFGVQISAWTKAPELGRWMWLLPISIFFSGIYQTLNSWSTRRKQFHRASISQVVRSVMASGAQTTAGIGKAGPIGLIGGWIAGDVCATCALAAQVLKDDSRLITQSLDVGRMKHFAKEYADFPLYGGTRGLLNSLSQSIPLILLTYYFGAVVAGLYFMSMRILQLPMNLVLISLRQVFFQKASEVYNTGGDTYALFKKVTLGLMSMAIGPALIIVFFAPPLFSFVLGAKWYVAGEYARWLVMWVALTFFNVPAVIFGQVYRKQRNLLLQEVALLICRAGALVIGGLYLDAIHTVILYSIVGVVFNIYIVLWMWRLLRYQADLCRAGI